MESPSQPNQPAVSSNHLSPNKTCDACTTPEKVLPSPARRIRGYEPNKQPYAQAVKIQSAIADTIKANGISTADLSSLSRVWLDLERFKRALRAHRDPFPGLPHAYRKKSGQEPIQPKSIPEAQPENPGPEFTEEP